MSAKSLPTFCIFTHFAFVYVHLMPGITLLSFELYDIVIPRERNIFDLCLIVCLELLKPLTFPK